MNASERQRNILNIFFRIKTKFQDGKKKIDFQVNELKPIRQFYFAEDSYLDINWKCSGSFNCLDLMFFVFR